MQGLQWTRSRSTPVATIICLSMCFSLSAPAHAGDSTLEPRTCIEQMQARRAELGAQIRKGDRNAMIGGIVGGALGGAATVAIVKQSTPIRNENDRQLRGWSNVFFVPIGAALGGFLGSLRGRHHANRAEKELPLLNRAQAILCSVIDPSCVPEGYTAWRYQDMLYYVSLNKEFPMERIISVIKDGNERGFLCEKGKPWLGLDEVAEIVRTRANDYP